MQGAMLLYLTLQFVSLLSLSAVGPVEFRRVF
jgi:hypothetical protein